MSYQPLSADNFSTDSALKKFDKVTRYFTANPLEVADVFPYHEQHVGQPFYVTMGELLDSHLNEEFTQYTVISTRVLDILATGDHAFIKTLVFNKPMRVGYHAEDLQDGYPLEGSVFIITGGRHRFTAKLTAYALSGVDITTAEFRAMKVRVEPELYSLAAILTDNGSRSMNSGEKLNIGAQELGIDVTDSDDIIAGFVAKKINKSKAFNLLFQCDVKTWKSEDDCPVDITELELNTAGLIGAKFINALSGIDPTQTARLKDAKHVQTVLTLAMEKLPSVLAGLKKKGTTNIALNGLNPTAEALSTYVMGKTKVKATRTAKKGTEEPTEIAQ